MTDFRQAIVEDTTPRASSEMGIQVVRIIEAVERSLQISGARVEVERATTGQASPIAPVV